jgi:hypothetical protein
MATELNFSEEAFERGAEQLVGYPIASSDRWDAVSDVIRVAAPLILAAEWEQRSKLTGDDRVSLGEALHSLDLLDDEDLSGVTFKAVEWFEQWMARRASELRGEA